MKKSWTGFVILIIRITYIVFCVAPFILYAYSKISPLLCLSIASLNAVLIIIWSSRKTKITFKYLKFDRQKDAISDDLKVTMVAATCGPNDSKTLAGHSERFPKSIQDLDIGFVKHKFPEEMKVGVQEEASIQISFNKESFSFLESESTVEELRITKLMKAFLLDQDGKFEIISANNPDQIILENDETSWKWYIKPIKSGHASLELIVSAYLNADGLGLTMKDIESFKKTIIVHINPLYSTNQFLLKNWQWIIGTICGSGIFFTILKLTHVIPS
ncbi:hypothetical protein [Mucilaginibacter aquaedulcis]|uniref:hypothetical protein n=1 Tax=Mucilaginibacter aquaedulcis TaxID=1187081 RepID=UPI0025B4A437|nr:hypothetical protein [Mucilaginibacter aquaedulcis]MDN3551255.1 hypothetical protein [Mucilaginibacter aquaedulcis]